MYFVCLQEVASNLITLIKFSGVEDFIYLSESLGKTNYEVASTFLKMCVNAFLITVRKFENVMDVCRYSGRKRKEGKELRKENQRAIKPRSC